MSPRRTMTVGIFITFEGGEGTGKSTQVSRLAAALRRHGHDVVVTREPGGSPLAEQVRALLLAPENADITPLAQALLFNAARSDHLARTIRPALARGAIVLCDRFMDSTRAYQGAAGGLDGITIDGLEALVVGATRPNLTIVLDLDPAVGLARADARRAPTARTDGFEARQLAFHERLRRGFLGIATRDPARVTVVDASADEATIAATIAALVTSRLGLAIG